MPSIFELIDQARANELFTFGREEDRPRTFGEHMFTNAQPTSFPALGGFSPAQQGFQFTSDPFNAPPFDPQNPFGLQPFDENNYSFLFPGLNDEGGIDLDEQVDTQGDKPDGTFGDALGALAGMPGGVMGVAGMLGSLAALDAMGRNPAAVNNPISALLSALAGLDNFAGVDLGDIDFSGFDDGLEGSEGTIGEDEPDEGDPGPGLGEDDPEGHGGLEDGLDPGDDDPDEGHDSSFDDSEGDDDNP